MHVMLKRSQLQTVVLDHVRTNNLLPAGFRHIEHIQLEVIQGSGNMTSDQVRDFFFERRDEDSDSRAYYYCYRFGRG